MAFNGINNLRDSTQSIKVERWQMQELKKCAQDPIYFIRNYVQINTKDHGMQKFDMYDFQEELIQKFNKYRFNITKFPRQCGKSTTTRGYILWYALFHADKVIAILANKLNLAQEQLQQLRDSYILLPMWMQPGVSQWNKRAVQFTHGTRIICAATSADGIRGMAINLLYLDEFAFVPSHIASDFIASVFPTISSGKTTKVIITSTPNGMNHFFDMWEESVEPESYMEDAAGLPVGSNGYVKSEIAWNVVPGRTEAWANAERVKIGEIRFNQEYKCEFVGSVATLIDHNFLKLMEYKKPMIIPKLPEYIKIWELPRSKAELDTRGYEYIASIDSGYGMHKDNTVMQICLVKSNITIHQVVCMAINKLDIDDFCKKAYLLLKKYHLPNLIVEQNGPGIAALKYFHNNLNYENLLHFDPRGRAMGLWASEKLKQTAVILLKTYVQRKFIKIYDKDTIHELQSFGQESVTKWGGLGGTKDDRVTALYWIIYYVQSPLFYGNIVDSVDIMKMEEDEIILGNEDDKREETDTMNRIKNIQYHMEQLENGVTYAPEEFRRLIENPEEESNAAGSVFFRS